MNKDKDSKKDDKYDQIQEELTREAKEDGKEEMPVSGRSVFEINRIKNRNTDNKPSLKKQNKS